MSQKGLISIILVTYNAEVFLQRCLSSIYDQAYTLLEIVVVDGASNDGTTNILRKNSDRIAFWQSEKDGGIYDAMNKALSYVRGEWIYFIGVDDVLTPEFSALALHLQDPSKIYYGSVWKSGKKYLGKLSAYHQAKTGINHQAMIYPASVFTKNRYNTAYTISADHVLNMGLHQNPSYSFEFQDYTIAIFNDTGVSSIQKDPLFEKNKASLILQHYGWKIYLRFLFKTWKARLLKR
jgi:glycosyltransferase involved in cell wall biosynthesis